MSLRVHSIAPVIILNFVIITSKSLSNTDLCKNKTMSEAIIEKCPFVADNHEFISQSFFGDCSKWCEIDSTKTLTRRNENDVLCLLYYDTFVQFCTKIITNGINNVTLVPNLKYTIHTVCSKLVSLPNAGIQGHNLKEIIKSPDNCERLCSDYNGIALTQCSLAYYFSSVDLGNSSHNKNSISNGVTKTNDIEPYGGVISTVTKNSTSNGVPPKIDGGNSANLNQKLNNVSSYEVPAKIHPSVENALENISNKVTVNKNPHIAVIKYVPTDDNSNNAPHPETVSPEKKYGNETLKKVTISTNASMQPTNVTIAKAAGKTVADKNVFHVHSVSIEKVPKNVVESPEKAIELEGDVDGKDDSMVNENEDIRYGQNSLEQNPADNACCFAVVEVFPFQTFEAPM